MVVNQVGKLYTGINPKSQNGIYYFTVYVARRYVYAMACSLFYVCPVFQVQLLMLLNTFGTIWYFQTRPHIGTIRRTREGFHECMKMFLAYHLFLFSNGFPIEIQFYSGYSYFIFILTLAFVNIMIISVEVAQSTIHKRKLNERKKANITKHRERMEMLDAEKKKNE